MNRCQDISIPDASLKAEFITKFFNGDYIDAFTIISNNPQLNTKAFVADTINQIATILLSLENNFQNGVIDYLTQQYSNFQNIIDNYNLKGNWNASTTYQIYNFVTYNNIDYLYINLTPSSGNLPTNTDYWVEINIQGEKGAPGLGVNLQYNWSATTPYDALDVVYYNNALWVARVANINKIPGSTEEWKTLSGPIVSFYNDGDIEISNLSVAVEPVQAGSGDPSPDNVRPISGWDAVGIQATGGNLIDSSNATSGLCGYRAGDTLDTVVASTRYSHSVQIPARGGLKLSYRSNNVSTFNQCIIECFVGRNWTRAITGAAVSDTTTVVDVTVPANTYDWVKVMYSAPARGVVGTNINGDTQLEPGSTATEYKPFTGNTYTIAIGQTVYGGTLTIDEDGSVKALVDRAMLGNVTWRKHPSYSHVFYGPSGTGQLVNSTKGVSNACVLYSGGTLASFASDSEYRFRIGDYIYINIPSVSNVTDLNTWIANNSLQICYELATPLTITLDPVTISTISGQTNNVWADAGDVSVELSKKYWEEFIKFKLASIYTDYIEPSGDSLYNGLIWFEVFNPQNWSYLTNRNYTWNQINTNNDTWESVDRGDY